MDSYRRDTIQPTESATQYQRRTGDPAMKRYRDITAETPEQRLARALAHAELRRAAEQLSRRSVWDRVWAMVLGVRWPR